MEYKESVNKIFLLVFGDKVRKRLEYIILGLAGLGFLIHLLLIFLKSWDFEILSNNQSVLLNDPITAIYTPFSLILIYEVYLLVFYLPRSFTSCVSKQFEIISLIVIRKIFKDIPLMDLQGDWHLSQHNLELMVDLLGFLILFLLIFLFNKGKKRLPKRTVTDLKLKSFISSKKVVSLVLLTLLTGTSTLSISNWLIDLYKDGYVKNIDNVFFNQFFTLLILTDVIILLISFRFTEEYSKLIRNTGFIISTILIRLSFSADGFLSIILILTGVSFALLILIIYNAIENPKLDSTV
ncbi:MAG: hypothetical protein P8M60_06455 [Flavobacteriaceae bacterium]|nr:hypothetical protein [Flavobacteriaceae bacterium]